MKRQSRGWISAGVGAVAGLAILLGLQAAPATAADVVRVGKAVPEAFSFVPVDIGIRKGIFAKHGVDVHASAFAGDAKLQQAMASDSLDISLGSGPAMAFVQKGAPIKAVGALTGAPQLMTVMVKKDGPVHTVADLKGRKVSVSTAGSLTYWLVSETSQSQGWGPQGINIVPLGAMPGQVAALQRGDTDGVVADISTALDLQNRGVVRILIRFGDTIKDFHTNVIYATNKLIAEKPQALRGFLAGWYETIAFMAANKAETVKITMDVIKKSEQISSQSYDVLMPAFSRDGKFNPKALAMLSKSFVAMKLLPSEPDMSKLYTEQFLP